MPSTSNHLTIQLPNHLQDILRQLRPQGPPGSPVEASRRSRLAPPVVREGTRQRRLRGRAHCGATLQPLPAVGTGISMTTQLCRKDMLIKNLRKHKRQLQKDKALVEEDWDFVPLTYFLPSEYIMLAEEFKKRGGLWIMKPTSRCQGQGIFIVDKLSQVAPFRYKPTPNQAANTPPPPKVAPRQAKKEDDKDEKS